ncbi:hypothetical protein AB0M23_32315 [Streptomyces sp. NPDC052077]|uniref:hypothetical protein n=1 Tax=Streptomyces sp. NPDC052077 TaxID=3154757 RepID=UPI003412F478
MTALPAPPAEPRHTRGGAGGAAPAWHRQKVKIPRRVWGERRYSPGAVAYWAQIAALAQRTDGCRAGVATLAGYLGDSKRTAERVLAELSAPGADGIPELTTRRRTGPDGDGETARRRVREAGDGHFAIVPVGAFKTLRRPLFVLYCALTHAEATGTPVTAAELGALLGVTEYSARRMVTELETAGWITVHRRAGAHGRHVYEVHEQPLHAVPDPAPRPHTDGGSGPCADGGSLVTKEDPRLTDERTTARRGSFRRRRDDRKWGPGSPDSPAALVDTAGNSAGEAPPAPAAPATPRRPVRPADRPPYTGPPLTLSQDAWELLRPVLAPVADLLPHVSPFMTRRIVREVLRQIRDEGIWPGDIAAQVTRLRAWTPADDLRDPGRWLLGAVLPVRSRCGTTGCHWGFRTHTGEPCKTCTEIEADRRGMHPPHRGPRPYACRSCGWGSDQPLPHDRCTACRPA